MSLTPASKGERCAAASAWPLLLASAVPIREGMSELLTRVATVPGKAGLGEMAAVCSSAPRRSSGVAAEPPDPCASAWRTAATISSAAGASETVRELDLASALG